MKYLLTTLLFFSFAPAHSAWYSPVKNIFSASKKEKKTPNNYYLITLRDSKGKIQQIDTRNKSTLKKITKETKNLNLQKCNENSLSLSAIEKEMELKNAVEGLAGRGVLSLHQRQLMNTIPRCNRNKTHLYVLHKVLKDGYSVESYKAVHTN